MTRREFDAEIVRLINRATMLRAARDGKIKLERVLVRRTRVREHWRREHVRLIAPRTS